MKKMLFVTFEGMLEKERQGGVQRCTHEYLAIFEEAGYDVRLCTIPLETGRIRSILRRSGISPYNIVSPARSLPFVLGHPEFNGSDIIALNHADLDELASGVRKEMSRHSRLILCSHGNKSTDFGVSADYPHAGKGFLSRIFYTGKLGRLLEVERRNRRWYDLVLCLSSMDAMLDQWLGAKNTFVVQRTVSGSPIEWSPVPGRIGFFGTLDHSPTLAALVEVGEAIKQVGEQGRKIRLVGSPSTAYDRHLSKYNAFEYLGYLHDQELSKEAGSWSLAIHPLFTCPMGASMKLASLLAMEIPVLSTTSALRGYDYAQEYVPQENSPNSFVREMFAIAASKERLGKLKKSIESARKAAPDIPMVAKSFNQRMEKVFN